MSTLIEKIRKKLADKTELNKILEAEEYTDPTIQEAVDDAVAEYNDMYEPKTSLGEAGIVFRTLFYGVACQLIENSKFHAKRNSINYNDAGESIDYYGAKDRALSEFLSFYSQKWERAVAREKANLNAQRFMGPIQ